MSLSIARQRDATQTRDRILRAAQHLFSTHGYAETGLREITAHAGVNLALVNRYFGTKEKLFEEAFSDVITSTQLIASDRSQYGKQVIESFVRLRDPITDSERHPLTMMMLAASDPGARAIVQRLLNERLVGPLSQWFGVEDAEARVTRVLAVTAGFFMYNFVYPMPSFAWPLSPETRSWLERTLQAIVDDPN